MLHTRIYLHLLLRKEARLNKTFMCVPLCINVMKTNFGMIFWNICQRFLSGKFIKNTLLNVFNEIFDISITVHRVLYVLKVAWTISD